MDKKNPNQKRNERPNVEEEERSDKGGLKVDQKSQGLKADATKLREVDSDDAVDDDDDVDETEEDE